jgi:hypothetical protein
MERKMIGMNEMCDHLVRNTSLKGSFSIEFNPNRELYETVEVFLGNHPDLFSFISGEDKKTCIETDTLITVRWCKDTPVGSYDLAASTIERLMKMVSSL